MLKGAGMLMMIAAGTALGFLKSREWSKRLSSLQTLLQTAVILKGEISYGYTSLPEAFLILGEKLSRPFSTFFQRLGRELLEAHEEPLKEAFVRIAGEELRDSGLTGEDRELFFRLGEQLGYLDIQMQQKQLLLFSEEIQRKIEEVRRELPAKQKIYQSLGLMGGLLLAVLVL